MGGKIAYLMSRFPHLPETFILREMVELSRQGWDVALYPLILQNQPVIHAEAKEWLAKAHVLPFVSAPVVGENLRQAFQRPIVYAGLWKRVLQDNRTHAGFLARSVAMLPKAVFAARQMQAEGVQHIHAHYATYPALVAWIINRLTGIPYSITVHAHDIFVRQEMLKTKLRHASFIVAISEYNREFLAYEVGEWTRAKTHVIHCGIEPERYPLRGTGNHRSARFEILNIGSLQPYKGQAYLVEACAQLRALEIPFRCRIIGEGEDRAALEQQVAGLNLGAQVELLGPLPQEEVAQLLPQTDCYVQPSIITPSGKMEGIPVALMEALACQVPCVATDISGVPEIIRAGKTGLLVPPADAGALAKALATVYQHPENAASLARAGRELVLEEFDVVKNTRQLGELFAGTI
jgi:colanic acid/amylovoran biosynthesis glycosyltransferase